MASSHDDRLAALERRLLEAPGDGDAHFDAGRINAELGRWDRAVSHLRVAAAADPDRAERWSRLATALHAAGRGAEARHAVERALSMNERLAEAWNTLGSLDAEAGARASARAHFLHALELQPDFALAHASHAANEEALGRIVAAEAGYRRAIEQDPASADAHYRLAALHHRKTLDLEQAIEHYRRAIALKPDFASAHHNLSHALLLQCRVDEAWPEHAWRPPRARHEEALARAGRRYVVPAAGAQPPRRLALISEQGLGDVLFFLRFARGLRERGTVLDFVGDARLHDLLMRTGVFASAVAKASELAPAERDEVLVGDLPLLLPGGSAPEALRLAPLAHRAQGARARLAAFGDRPWIGLAWRSGDPQTGPFETLLKTVPLEPFASALRGIEATFVAVQREPRAGELEAISRALGKPVHDLSHVNRDLEDALATMEALDDYVGMSSTNVHLRAGVGLGARVVVPFPPEWRWLAAGRSVWFPAMDVYRQAPDGDWTAAFERLSSDLSRAASARRVGP